MFSCFKKTNFCVEFYLIKKIAVSACSHNSKKYKKKNFDMRFFKMVKVQKQKMRKLTDNFVE